MIKLTKKRAACAIFVFTLCLLFVFFMSHQALYAYGPGETCGMGMGSGMGMGMGMGSGMGSGMGMGFGAGRGLRRDCGLAPGAGGPRGFGGFGPGFGSKTGMMSRPSYCQMLLDRQDLNLSPEQREALKKLQISHMKGTFDLRSDLQINKIELRKLRFSKNPDFNLIKGKLEKISKLQLELQISRAKLQIDADKILTDEQKDSLYLIPGMAVDVEMEDISLMRENIEPEE